MDVEVRKNGVHNEIQLPLKCYFRQSKKAEVLVVGRRPQWALLELQLTNRCHAYHLEQRYIVRQTRSRYPRLGFTDVHVHDGAELSK